jgi:protein-tyrosine-phosphatase/predicted ATP-grasp superfamily ATP-dependent carboligase
MPVRILVFGDDTRSFLAIVRSLGRAGHDVHVAPFDRRSAALRSRYITGIHWLPFYLGDGSDWVADLGALIDRLGIDLVIPCDERALLPLHAHRDSFTRTTLALPAPDAVDAFYDKHRTRELARSEGVAIAPGRLLRTDDTAAALAAELGLPLALKPRCSYSLEGLHARGKVVLAADLDALSRELPRLDPDATVVEAFVPGTGGGISVLAADGEVLQAFEHHRVHDDLAVGGSYYRRSARLTPVLLAAVQRIVAAVRYTGVAMFEFRIDTPNGRYALLEVNARPWGSMPLPVALGVDFPERWRRLLMTGERTVSVRYRPGMYGRNLVPDLEHMVLELRRAGGHPVKLARILLGRSVGMYRLARGRERLDTFARDDLGPGLAELRQLARTTAGKLAHRLPGTLARQRRRGWRALHRLRGGDPEPRVVFVCAGNICRSPFAAELARQSAPRTWRLESAGTLPVVDRASPNEAVTAAREHGIDLLRHRSRHLDRDLVNADLLVVFDDNNVAAVTKRYPEAVSRMVKLGWFLDEGDPDIPDPFGDDLEAYRRTYRRIDEAVRRIAEALR